MSGQLQFSDLILPINEQPSISHLLSDLRRATLSIHNRLASIRADADFVVSVCSDAAYPGRPLVANERCGSWYVPPERKAGSAYFKSTDGHERAWKFSTRRLNLHLIEMIEERDGIIIVDSTRRGKRMPDALSTTIPIWCTVLNQALLPNNPLSNNLFLPPHLPATTHAQISALISSFVSSLKSLNLTLPTCLTKPLRPLWVTQESALADNSGTDADDGDIFDDYRPVICCTASRRVVGSEMDEGGYIQGAGDDTENWAHGLTAPIFWKHVDQLLDTPESELPDLIRTLVKDARLQLRDEGTERRQITPYVSVTTLPVLLESLSSSECCVELTSETTPKETWEKSPRHLVAGLGKSKAASRNLRQGLADICSFVAKHLDSTASQGDTENRIVIGCESGKDLSIGTALAISCYLFSNDGTPRNPSEIPSFTKDFIKARLGAIMTAYPEANPNRATLQSVNSFLMDWRK